MGHLIHVDRTDQVIGIDQFGFLVPSEIASIEKRKSPKEISITTELALSEPSRSFGRCCPPISRFSRKNPTNFGSINCLPVPKHNSFTAAAHLGLLQFDHRAGLMTDRWSHLN